ncbi:hypothetical protein DJ73_04570 [Halorubrum sp. Ea1]|uniref:DUF6498-containing protein n=1 Tax=Halorubrum sp. Ea1 TaxID=1480718 RepID=UPI000B9882F2|nr:DUF6498-containing protein [Halorubrum sp. Ea1]OYR54581.1 hypothetical protein DJ73_04570 [Halorubrum sp. Ea1]
MPSTARSGPLSALARGRRFRALALFVSNLLPLAGVVALGWNAAALMTLYWFELGIASLWALVRALFAGRPSEIERTALIAGPLASRRAALSVPRTGVQIRLSSLLVLPVIAPILCAVWLFVGGLTVGVVADGGLSPDALDTVTLAVLAVFVGEGATTLAEYFAGGEYRDHSAQTAVRGVFVHAGAVFFAALFTVALVGAATLDGDAPISALDPDAVGLPLLLGVIGLKAAVDLAGLYRDRLDAFDESQALDLGFSYDPPTTDSVHSSLDGPVDAVRLPRRSRFAGALATVSVHPGLWWLAAVPVFVAALFAIGGDWTTVTVLSVVAVAVPLSLAAVDHELRHGLVAYRAGDDALVARDRLFGATLWRVESWDETGLRVERTWLDRRLGTETVVIELRDEEHRVPGLSDPDTVLAVFDRRADRPDD